MPRILITAVGIDDLHLFAIADFVHFFSECMLVISLDESRHRFDQPGRRGLMNLLTLPYFERGDARRSFELGRPFSGRGKYTIFDVPAFTPDAHGRSEPNGRSDGLSEGNASMFVNKPFRLGRSLRVGPQYSRDWVRRFCLDWAVVEEVPLLVRFMVGRSLRAATCEEGQYNKPGGSSYIRRVAHSGQCSFASMYIVARQIFKSISTVTASLIQDGTQMRYHRSYAEL